MTPHFQTGTSFLEFSFVGFSNNQDVILYLLPNCSYSDSRLSCRRCKVVLRSCRRQNLAWISAAEHFKMSSSVQLLPRGCFQFTFCLLCWTCRVPPCPCLTPRQYFNTVIRSDSLSALSTLNVDSACVCWLNLWMRSWIYGCAVWRSQVAAAQGKTWRCFHVSATTQEQNSGELLPLCCTTAEMGPCAAPQLPGRHHSCLEGC